MQTHCTLLRAIHGLPLNVVTTATDADGSVTGVVPSAANFREIRE